MRAGEVAALSRVMATAPPDRRLTLAALVCGTLALLAGAALLACSGALISKAALRPPVLALGVLIVTVRGLGLVRAAARYGERLGSHDAALRSLARLRGVVFARLVPLVPGAVGHRAGDLLTRFVADVDALQDLYVRALAPPALALATGLVTVTVAAVLLPVAGLVLLAGLLVAGVAVPLLTARLAREAGRRQAAARAELAGAVLDLARFGPELAVLGHRGTGVARVAAADGELRRLARRDALAGSVAAGAGTLAQGATVLATLLVALPAVRDGALDGILLAALVGLTLAAFEATAPLPAAAQRLGACAASAGRLTGLLDTPVPVADPDRPTALPGGGPLALRGVRARAGAGGAVVLDGVDLTVAPGEAVGLVGPSGAGKTTLAQLLVRFRDPDAGAVTLDGTDVRALRQAELRGVVRLIAQDAAVFTTTLAEDVRLARPAADDDAVRGALEQAGLGPWLATLPAGLGTLLGEDGETVSGGQRQRIALARAFLADARFLVVDEPTTHLDEDAADALLHALVAHARARRQGLLVIVHGGAGLAAFDRVVELRGGHLAPVGVPLAV